MLTTVTVTAAAIATRRHRGDSGSPVGKSSGIPTNSA
jgi:hypothetical protein